MVEHRTTRAASARLLRKLAFALVLLTIVSGSAGAQAPSPSASTSVSSLAAALPQQPAAVDTAPVPMNNAPEQPDAQQWNYGSSVQTKTWNCTIIGQPYEEVLATNFAAYYGDPGVTPRVGDVYYVMGTWAVSGSPCGNGGAYVHLEVFLPKATELAIDANNPVLCFHDDYRKNPVQSQRVTDGCPQQPGQGQQGGLAFDPPQSWGTNGLWPTATGIGWRIMIPVRSREPLNGILANPCDVCMTAAIWAIDGNYSPWAYPKVPIYVGQNTPSISYPNPSATNISGTGAHLRGYLYSHYTAGQVYVDVGTTTNYGMVDGPLAISADHDSYQIDSDWNNLQPNTTYHWRLRYVTGGQTYYGPDQTFTTTDGGVTPRVFVPLLRR